MTSRLDVVDLEIRTSFKDVLKCIVENAYSRIPVYAETRDNIKGANSPPYHQRRRNITF